MTKRRLEYVPDSQTGYNAECQDGACRQPAAVHFLVAEPYPGEPDDTCSVVQLCAGHGGPWERRLRELVLEVHGFRTNGSACGLEGAIWVERDNLCVVPVDFDSPELAALAALTLEMAGQPA